MAPFGADGDDAAGDLVGYFHLARDAGDAAAMTSVIGLGGEGQKAGQGQARQLGFQIQGIQVREFHIRLQDSFPAGMVNQEPCQCENVGFRAEKGIGP